MHVRRPCAHSVRVRDPILDPGPACHRVEHLPGGPSSGCMGGAWLEEDLAVEFGGFELQEGVLEAMNCVVEEVIVGLADVDANLATGQFRAQRLPIALQHQPEVVVFPMSGHGAVDDAGGAVPEGDGRSVIAARAEDGVPASPLLAAEFPSAATTEGALQATLVTDGEEGF